jgi:hypothetical protein
MRITFNERFALPIDEVFSYFVTPADWGRLYGFAGVRDLGSGWFAVGLKGFPFPLVAKSTVVEENELVRWTFRGFWRGHGEIRFTSSPGSVLLEGYEDIAVRWLFFLSPLVERLLLESRFRAIWQLGWRRLRKREPPAHPEPGLRSTVTGTEGAI